MGDDAAPLEIAWLEIADPPELWQDLGFTVDGDGRCVIGSVEHRLVGPPNQGEPGGIVRWAVFGPGPEQVGPDGIDGLPTLLLADPYRPHEVAPHPNGVFRIDHLVIATSDTPRTAAEFTAVGLGRRGGRTTNSAGHQVDMTFFWAGDVLLELSGPPTPSPDPEPAHFRGVAYASHDLDGTVALLAGRTTVPRDAVQPGRRIAALVDGVGSTLPLAFMTPHVPKP
ncbi:MAG: VOC family protein [Acidimicrobiia bacterium]|nr:VOC family protein [Acidimicrobiia bacterium]